MAQNAHADGDGRRVVTVKLGKEVFGFPIETIEGIVPWEPLTRVPKMPGYVAGIVSIRGSVLVVIDLRTRLGLDAAECTTSNRIVIAQIADQRAGLIVDSVEEVAWVSEHQIDRECHGSAAVGEEFMEGVAQVDGRLVLLLRADCVLTTKELEGLSAVKRTAA